MSAAKPGTQRELFGHPVGLTYLFGTEMWERCSYYGMRLLIPLYCVQFLLLPGHHDQVIGFEAMRRLLECLYGRLNTPQQLQSAIYGIFGSLLYFTPLAGGFLADRYFGRRYTVLAGGFLMAIGHFLMAFEPLFYIALLFLILGNGGFKPNISTQVAGLYRAGDHRIDRAYSIFYLGINLGSFLGINICGAFGEARMWSYGFAAAGIGMLLGTLIYLCALRVLPDDRPQRAARAAQVPLSRQDWRAVVILWLLFVPGCLFWAAYGQSGNTVEIWSIDHVDRFVHVGGVALHLSVGFIQSLNAILILLLTPLVVGFWRWQERRQREPNAVLKMAQGCLLLSLGYLVLALAQKLAGHGQVHWLWVLLYFVFFTLGELYFSPVGLALYGKTAPPQVAALMMAAFLATSFPGNYLAGWLGTFYSTLPLADFFLMTAAVALAPLPMIWLLDRPLHKTRLPALVPANS